VGWAENDVSGITLGTVPGAVREVVRNAIPKGACRSILSRISQAVCIAIGTTILWPIQELTCIAIVMASCHANLEGTAAVTSATTCRPVCAVVCGVTPRARREGTLQAYRWR
jgi:hypothetical protein